MDSVTAVLTLIGLWVIIGLGGAVITVSLELTLVSSGAGVVILESTMMLIGADGVTWNLLLLLLFRCFWGVGFDFCATAGAIIVVPVLQGV